MTKIDDAIQLCNQDAKKQAVFYELFLNSLFYIPILAEEGSSVQEEGAPPLLVEANDKTYLMLFDTISRLTDWANEDAKYLAVSGHGIVEMSSPNIYWALNYGTELQKFFEPAEIKWLKMVVKEAKEKEPIKTNAENEENQEFKNQAN
ncbi:SseB protein N-terminal domain-containing protein [Desulfuromusa kysingii]|uniref:SseB protein N-terminal domain-containing protein n=1 Tax=Desulfuromusa kysingii TaxID=37625 RepID=A0A1H4BKT9_9BACT|nr:SseB family protein [Desulfuromusa kysingii]SEA48664.1 SseB protein N-terminal domain-containing protein [Desulfuromusa kysingii]